MDPLLELAKWAPAPLVLWVAWKLLKHVATKILDEFDVLKKDVKQALLESQNRVTVSDHRESMRQVWEAHHALKEKFIEERAERRAKRSRV